MAAAVAELKEWSSSLDYEDQAYVETGRVPKEEES